MTFYDWYMEKINAVKTAVQAICSAAIGPYAKITSFPFAIIVPGESKIEDSAVKKLKHIITVDIVVVVNSQDQDEAIQTAANIYDQLMGDRTLGGTVNLLTPRMFVPGFYGTSEKASCLLRVELECYETR